MKLNIEGYTAVSASIILLLSKMQQKPHKAAKAPYVQILSLKGEQNFLMNFKGRYNYFSLKLHLKIVLSKKKSDLQSNPHRYDNKVGGFCSILLQLDLSKADTQAKANYVQLVLLDGDFQYDFVNLLSKSCWTTFKSIF